MMERYTPQTQKAPGLALGVAKTLNHGYVGTEHLLIGLLQEETRATAKVLGGSGVEEDRAIELVSQLITPNPAVQITDRMAYAPRVRRAIGNSYREAVHFKAAQIETEHILTATLREGDCVASRLLNTTGANIRKLYIGLLTAMSKDAPTIKDDLQGVRVGKRSSTTPTLDSYSRDLIQLAITGELGPVIGRGQEIQCAIQIPSRRIENNLCLIGEPGVGKAVAVEGLAQMTASDDVPETVADRRVVALDLSDMAAGSRYRGESEGRIKKVISEAMESGNVLLFTDEVYTIIRTGGAEGTLDASNILRLSLVRSKIQLVGATTVNEYHKYIERDSALERCFQPMIADEPTEKESVAILKEFRSRYEERHKVEVTDNVLEMAAKLSSRYINDRFLSDKAVGLVDGAAPKVYLQNYTKPDKIRVYKAEIDGLEEAKGKVIKRETYEKTGKIERKQEKLREKITQTMGKQQKDKEGKKLIVSSNEVTDVVSGQTRILVRKLAEEESEHLGDPENVLHQRMMGQEEAVAVISKVVHRGRVGLKDPKHPIGFFLFLGLTDVGEAELSKVLSEVMFGTENALICVDMFEYMEKHSISRVIESPPGYVGYDEEGQLNGEVRRNPYSIILFDEIERAHPGVFNILLQVLDNSRITDAQGRRIDSKNAIVVMTSNIGTENIISSKRLGFGIVSDVEANYTFMKG